MPTPSKPSKPSKPSSKVVESLPERADKNAEVVKGGVQRRGGADDDLEDLEVDQ